MLCWLLHFPVEFNVFLNNFYHPRSIYTILKRNRFCGCIVDPNIVFDLFVVCSRFCSYFIDPEGVAARKLNSAKSFVWSFLVKKRVFLRFTVISFLRFLMCPSNISFSSARDCGLILCTKEEKTVIRLILLLMEDLFGRLLCVWRLWWRRLCGWRRRLFSGVWQSGRNKSLTRINSFFCRGLNLLANGCQAVLSSPSRPNFGQAAL